MIVIFPFLITKMVSKNIKEIGKPKYPIPFDEMQTEPFIKEAPKPYMQQTYMEQVVTDAKEKFAIVQLKLHQFLTREKINPEMKYLVQQDAETQKESPDKRTSG